MSFRLPLALATLLLLTLCTLSAQHHLFAVRNCDEVGHKLYGVIRTDGEVIVPFEYDDVSTNVPGVIECTRGDSLYLFRSDGAPFVEGSVEEIIPPYEWGDEFGLMPVKKNGKWGFYSYDATLVIPHRFDEVSDFIDGYAKVRIGNDTSAIGGSGEMLPLSSLTDPDRYVLGGTEIGIIDFAPIPTLKAQREKGKVGIVDEEGDWRVRPAYDDLYYLPIGEIWLARTGTAWGAIDDDGEIIVPLKYCGITWLDYLYEE